MNSNIKIIQGDITTLEVDAIVNAANPSLMGGGGVDRAIHKAAGPQLKNLCRPLRGCHTGSAKITDGCDLKATYVIHAVGPVWNNGTQAEESLLASAYLTCLEIAESRELKSIAFPSISTGSYRFPFEKATTIAINTITNFLKRNNMSLEVILVAFSDKDFKQMNKIFNEL